MKVVIILISKVPLAEKALMKVINISEGSMGKKNIKRVLLGLCGVFYPLSLFPERCDTNQLDTQIRGDLISPLGLKQDHHLGGDVLPRYH